jgi:hypothetical protein
MHDHPELFKEFILSIRGRTEFIPFVSRASIRRRTEFIPFVSRASIRRRTEFIPFVCRAERKEFRSTKVGICG